MLICSLIYITESHSRKLVTSARTATVTARARTTAAHMREARMMRAT